MSAYDKEAALIDQAKREGIEEGITEGIEQKQKEMVKEMLKEKIDIEIISKVTKLTIEEINTIKELIES